MGSTVLEGEEAPASAQASVAPLQVRGRAFTAVVVKVVGDADAAFFAALESLMRQAPRFFLDAPLVIDLEQAPDLHSRSELIRLVRELRARRLHPVGVQNASAEQGVAASGAGLVTLQGGRDAPMPRRGGDGAPAAADAEPSQGVSNDPAGSGRPGLLVTEPVRSGQRIFADSGDLVVVAPVSVGAELVAQGNIHVYGPLRGRALAGVNGDRTARIFCQSLEAELVAIAGLYRTSDDLDSSLMQRAAQALLRDGVLCVEAFKPSR